VDGRRGGWVGRGGRCGWGGGGRGGAQEIVPTMSQLSVGSTEPPIQ